MVHAANKREVLVDKSQRNSRESIPWRSGSAVSIFRHIYFRHEMTTMTSETSENAIFVRFFAWSYLIPTIRVHSTPHKILKGVNFCDIVFPNWGAMHFYPCIELVSSCATDHQLNTQTSGWSSSPTSSTQEPIPLIAQHVPNTQAAGQTWKPWISNPGVSVTVGGAVTLSSSKPRPQTDAIGDD